VRMYVLSSECVVGLCAVRGGFYGGVCAGCVFCEFLKLEGVLFSVVR
jgi:hypothetical protein